MARTKKYQPTEFMLPTSHYDKERADHAVNFIQSLKHTKGVWAGQPPGRAKRGSRAHTGMWVGLRAAHIRMDNG